MTTDIDTMLKDMEARIIALKQKLDTIPGVEVTITVSIVIPGESPLPLMTLNKKLGETPAPPAPVVPPTVEDRSLEAFKAMIRRGDFVVLDTETTGLDNGEICQIAVIDARGVVLLDTLVKPVGRIPADATRIHGITDSHVANAPSWAEVSAQLEKLLTGRDVVIYNATYDRKMMHKSAEAAKLPKTDWKQLARFWCAMEAFAEVYGDWNDYRGNYRWQKLTTAASYYHVPTNNAHSALGDCKMTLAVCRHMAGLGSTATDF
jgi:DNA polymerase-3 subunit epsilon